jgi:hypothetical protein
MPVLDTGKLLVLVVGRVGAVQRHGCHVPVERGHVDAEFADRPGPDAVGEFRQVRGDGVQGPAQTVVVEQVRLNPEDFFHRPFPGPAVHPPQGCGRGQPVGHQSLDDLAVRHMGDVAARAQPVDGPGHIKPAQKLGSDRQSAQTLLHHGGDHAFHARTHCPWPRGPGSFCHTRSTRPPRIRHPPRQHSTRISHPRSTKLG